jgi:hypothetical protein
LADKPLDYFDFRGYIGAMLASRRLTARPMAPGHATGLADKESAPRLAEMAIVPLSAILPLQSFVLAGRGQPRHCDVGGPTPEDDPFKDRAGEADERIFLVRDLFFGYT